MDGPGVAEWEAIGAGASTGSPPRRNACRSPMKHRVEVGVEEKVVNLDWSNLVAEYNICYTACIARCLP